MKKRVIKLNESDLERIVQRILKESPEFGNILGKTRMHDYNTFKGEKLENYMFFQNLRDMRDNIEDILSMEESKVDSILSNGHDWASDHIATSKDDVEEVHHFLKHGDTIKEEIDLMIAFNEGEKVSEAFNTLMSHLNTAQSVRLSPEAMEALEIVKNEINNLPK